MSTHHPSAGHQNDDRNHSPAPTADEARRMLADAARMGNQATDAVPPVLITFSILCAVGTMAAIGIHISARVIPDLSFNAPLAITIASMAWVLVSITVPFLFRRPLRRGLAVRWFVYMGAWAILWAACMILGTTFAGLALSPLFLVLFMIAATTEAKRAKTAKAELGAAQSAVSGEEMR